MELINNSSFDINCFKNAVLINELGGEFCCVGIGFTMPTFEIVINLVYQSKDSDELSEATVLYSSIKDWTIQFNSAPIQFKTK